MTFPDGVQSRIDALADRRPGDTRADLPLSAADLGAGLGTAFRADDADLVVAVYAFDDEDALAAAERRVLGTSGRHVRTALNGDLLLVAVADPDDRAAVERADATAQSFAGEE